MYINLVEILSVDFGTTDQLLIRYCMWHIWHNRSTAHQILYMAYLAQQINCSSDTVYRIFITQTSQNVQMQ